MSAASRSDSRWAVAAVALGLASIGFGVAGMTAALGAASIGVLIACLALGWRGAPAPDGPARRRVLAGLGATYAVQAGLIAGMALLDDPHASPRMWLGLPAPTALLVFALWPLGVMPALLFALRFRDAFLPEERLRRFLDAHGRRN